VDKSDDPPDQGVALRFGHCPHVRPVVPPTEMDGPPLPPDRSSVIFVATAVR